MAFPQSCPIPTYNRGLPLSALPYNNEAALPLTFAPAPTLGGSVACFPARIGYRYALVPLYFDPRGRSARSTRFRR